MTNERFDEHLSFRLPDGFWTEQSVDDNGKEKYVIFCKEERNESGGMEAKLTVSVSHPEKESELEEEKRNLNGNFHSVVTAQIKEYPVLLGTVNVLLVVVIVELNRHPYVLSCYETVRNREELDSFAERAADCLNTLLKSMVLDGEPGSMETITGQRLLELADVAEPLDKEQAEKEEQEYALRQFRQEQPQGEGISVRAIYRDPITGKMKRDLFWERAGAEAGDPDAMIKLGTAYLTGDGVERDPAKAVEYYRRVAEMDESVGQYNMGIQCARGEGIQRDFAAAISWMEKARDNGDPDAVTQLKLLRDAPEIEKKAYAGDAEAQARFSTLLANYSSKENVKESVEMAQRSVDQGCPRGYHCLGTRYDYGMGVEKDPVKAADLYRQGAELGSPECQYSYAVCFKQGSGVQQSDENALKWAIKAAEQGHAAAAASISLESGSHPQPIMPVETIIGYLLKAEEKDPGDVRVAAQLGVQYINLDPSDYEKSIYWYERAAELGDENAGHMAHVYHYRQKLIDEGKLPENIGVMSYIGYLQRNNLMAEAFGEEPVKKEPEYDIDEVLSGVENEDPESIKRYGYACFVEGESVYDHGIDKDRAMSLLERLSETDPEAAGIIGLLYLNGSGVNKDEELAADWLEKAVNAGGSGFEDALERARAEIGPMPDLECKLTNTKKGDRKERSERVRVGDPVTLTMSEDGSRICFLTGAGDVGDISADSWLKDLIKEKIPYRAEVITSVPYSQLESKRMNPVIEVRIHIDATKTALRKRLDWDYIPSGVYGSGRFYERSEKPESEQEPRLQKEQEEAIAEEERRLEEEQRQAEERRLEEERRQAEEEQRRLEEERRQAEEEQRRLEEERRQAEEQRRLEEERRQAEEEQRRLEEEQRRAEEARAREEAERKKKLEEIRFEDAVEQARTEALKQREKRWLETNGKHLTVSPALTLAKREFVFSGLQPCRETDEYLDKLRSHGAKIENMLSKKTDYLVCDPRRAGDVMVQNAAALKARHGKPTIVLLNSLRDELNREPVAVEPDTAKSEQENVPPVDSTASEDVNSVQTSDFKAKRKTKSSLGIIVAVLLVLAGIIFAVIRMVEPANMKEPQTAQTPAPGADVTPSPAVSATEPLVSNLTIAPSELSEYQEKAKAGDGYSMYMLGQMYDSGTEVKQDYTTALEWYEKASEAGYAEASYAAGRYYYDGRKTSQDYAKAKELFEKAADAGVREGIYYMGLLYYGGRGVQQDYAKAMEWLQRVIDADFDRVTPLAEYVVGVMYCNGEGVDKDYNHAFVRLHNAAVCSVEKAYRPLGVLYVNGWGTPRDYSQGMKWLLKGAEAGDAQAMKEIGKMYENGLGVSADQDKAQEWYRKAEQAQAG